MISSVSGRPPRSRARSRTPWQVHGKTWWDSWKWVFLMATALMSAGWFAQEYIGKFQTRDDAKEAQVANTQAHNRLERSVDELHSDQETQRYITVSLELQTKNVSDQLRQLVELEAARTVRQRREAQQRVTSIQERVDRREAIIANPAAVKAVADRRRRDPLAPIE